MSTIAISRIGFHRSVRRRAASRYLALLAVLLWGLFVQTASVARAQAAPATPTATSATTAAAAKDEPILLDAFVSTGTRFNDRTVIQSPVPIDVITSAEMQQGGYTETSQMLQALVPSFNFPASVAHRRHGSYPPGHAARPRAGSGAGARQRQAPSHQRARERQRLGRPRLRLGGLQRLSRPPRSAGSRCCATARPPNTAPTRSPA